MNKLRHIAIYFVIMKGIVVAQNDQNMLNVPTFNKEAKSFYDEHIAPLPPEQRNIIAEYFKCKQKAAGAQERLSMFGITFYDNSPFGKKIREEQTKMLQQAERELKQLVSLAPYVAAKNQLEPICTRGDSLVSITTEHRTISARYEKVYELIGLLTATAHIVQKKKLKQETENYMSSLIIMPKELLTIILQYMADEPLVFDRLTLFVPPKHYQNQNRSECAHDHWSDHQNSKPFDFDVNQFPLPKANTNTWPTQDEFLNRLQHIEWAANSGINITYVTAKGVYTSPLSDKQMLGMYYYTDHHRHLYWPLALSTYYIPKHNVKPSKEFYDYVMNFPLKEIYGIDPTTTFFTGSNPKVISANNKFIAS